ncbi:MAG: sulfurtransferase TusA family protein [Planctomycetota bacterium]|nr:sulfurtransferase TusA family protein [Planctomycetota bacterium]
MTQPNQLDVRGLYCPEPVLRTKSALGKLKSGTIEVLVDSGAPRDNVTRFARKGGWAVAEEKMPNGSLRLTLKK